MFFLLAERDNKIIHIDEITPEENGLKCDCVCPICKEPLKANTLGKIKRKHFSHKADSDCINHLETVAHKLAKQIIEDNKRIIIPRLSYNFETLVDEQNIEFTEVKLEKYFADYNFKPDIIATSIHNNKEMKLIIEIAVTHVVDEAKLQKIKCSNISALEIYIDTTKLTGLSLNEIKHIILEDTSNKKWLFNRGEARKIKDIREKIRKRELERINREKERVKKIKHYTLKKIRWRKNFFKDEWYGFVYKCPMSTLEEHDLRIADIDKCAKCIYFDGFIKEEWKKISVKCKGKY